MEVALRSRVPSSVTADVRDLGGRDVVWVDVDASTRSGASSSESSLQLEHAARTAASIGIPLVCLMRSSGADIVEGFAALHGWGRAAPPAAACSGVVPTIFVVDGPAVSGPALLIGLADLVVMTTGAYAFVSGPTMVADFTGVVVDKFELGGSASHARYTGAASLVADDLAAATSRSTAPGLPPVEQQRRTAAPTE